MFVDEKRPRKFSEVIGNEVTVKTFKKYSKDNSFPQVMILAGHTGTGKSTLGYITAMKLTCENPLTMRGGYQEPCGKCDACLDVISERFSRDVIYKNASAMGKEEVNKLESEVNQSAVYGDCKVIIVEEAQELASKGAIGALLKILEKPRKGVKFILLTMDANALVKAMKNTSILDRGQMYNFKPHPTRVVGDYLMKLLDEIDPEEKLPPSFIGVVTAIADNSGGSVRRALQHFQRCVDGEIYTEDQLIEELEIVTEEKIESIILGLLQSNPSALFSLPQSSDLTSLFSQMWGILIRWKKDGALNSYFSEAYQKKVNHALSFPSFDKLLTVFMETNKANTGYFNPNNFFYFLLKFVEETKVVKSRRSLKD